RGASAALPFRRIHPMRRRIGLLRRKLRLHQESLDIGYAHGSVLSAANIIGHKDRSHDRRCVLRHAPFGCALRIRMNRGWHWDRLLILSALAQASVSKDARYHSSRNVTQTGAWSLAPSSPRT